MIEDEDSTVKNVIYLGSEVQNVHLAKLISMYTRSMLFEAGECDFETLKRGKNETYSEFKLQVALFLPADSVKADHTRVYMNKVL